ncbi:MAG: hypothetical protein HRU19_27315 [Pseudobacteriovorax sp.]|nr:hypothetical protein [Pseudobacteriovorax sp.]
MPRKIKIHQVPFGMPISIYKRSFSMLLSNFLVLGLTGFGLMIFLTGLSLLGPLALIGMMIAPFLYLGFLKLCRAIEDGSDLSSDTFFSVFSQWKPILGISLIQFVLYLVVGAIFIAIFFTGAMGDIFPLNMFTEMMSNPDVLTGKVDEAEMQSLVEKHLEQMPEPDVDAIIGSVIKSMAFLLPVSIIQCLLILGTLFLGGQLITQDESSFSEGMKAGLMGIIKNIPFLISLVFFSFVFSLLAFIITLPITIFTFGIGTLLVMPIYMTIIGCVIYFTYKVYCQPGNPTSRQSLDID